MMQIEGKPSNVKDGSWNFENWKFEMVVIVLFNLFCFALLLILILFENRLNCLICYNDFECKLLLVRFMRAK